MFGGKSVATVHERTRRLKEKGYIKGVVAVLDGRKIGPGLIAFSHVLLNDHIGETLDNFEQSVAMFPELKSETAFPLQTRAERKERR